MKRYLKFNRTYPVGDSEGTIHEEGAVIEVDNEASFDRWMRRNCCEEVSAPSKTKIDKAEPVKEQAKTVKPAGQGTRES